MPLLALLDCNHPVITNKHPAFLLLSLTGCFVETSTIVRLIPPEEHPCCQSRRACAARSPSSSRDVARRRFVCRRKAIRAVRTGACRLRDCAAWPLAQSHIASSCWTLVLTPLVCFPPFLHPTPESPRLFRSYQTHPTSVCKDRVSLTSPARLIDHYVLQVRGLASVVPNVFPLRACGGVCVCAAPSTC